jgi:hypothetical protein
MLRVTSGNEHRDRILFRIIYRIDAKPHFFNRDVATTGRLVADAGQYMDLYIVTKVIFIILPQVIFPV